MLTTQDLPPDILAVPQQTGDVQSWDTFFAPDDDIHGVIVDELKRAVTARAECQSSQYAFTDQDIADLFVKLGKNKLSRFLFDKTQAAGTHERPILHTMLAKIPANNWAIGTSSTAHQILHTKAIAIRYADGTGWTVTGSFNLSHSAEDQFNIVDVVRSRSRADLFASRISAMFTWVKTNQPSVTP